VQPQLTEGAASSLANARRESAGELGEVYRGGGGNLAIKLARRADAVGNFAQEALALAWAGSPLLPRLRAVGWWEPGRESVAALPAPSLRPCLVLDWVGERRGSTASPVELAVDLASALADIHGAGLAHGDVKLENVVFDRGHARLVDLGLAVPSDKREIAGGTPRYLATSDRDMGNARQRDLLALGVLFAESCDTRVREARDPIARARALAGELELGPWIAPLLAPTPSARPQARWIVETASKRGTRETASLVAGRKRAIRAAYLRARPYGFGGRPPTDAAPYLDSYLTWRTHIAAAFEVDTDDREIELLDRRAIARWLTLLIGPDVASWPVGPLADRGEREIALAMERLALAQPPEAWTLSDLEGALLSSEAGTSAEHDDGATRVARLAMELSEVPPRARAIDEVEQSDSLPSSLLLKAARALRLRGEIGRATVLAERAARDLPSAREDLADLVRRGGDLERATAEANASGGGAIARSVLGRIALDRGEPTSALQKVQGIAHVRAAEVEALAEAALGEIERAMAALDRGAAYARTAEDRARIFGARGYVLSTSDPSAAREAYLVAADHAVRAGSVVEEATYLTGRAALSIDEGFIEDGLSSAERASLLWEALERPEMSARAHLAAAAGLRILGRVEKAERALSALSEGATRAGDLRALGYSHLVRCDMEAGRSKERGAASAMAARACLLRRGETAAVDDRLRTEARVLRFDAAPMELTAIDALARESGASAGARLDWWGARAAALDESERADEILSAIVALASAKAPVVDLGVALDAGITLAGDRGRSDVAERLRAALRDHARRLVGRAGASVLAEVNEIPWVKRHLSAEIVRMDAEQTNDLEKLVRSLGSGERLSVLLRQIVDALVLWTGVERGLLLLRAPDGRLIPRAARNFARRDLEGEQRELPQSLARRALDAKEPIVAVDASGELAGLHKSVHALKLRSILAVPLFARGEAIGVVYLDDRIRRGAFGPRELAWVRTIATLAGSMIESARDQLLLRRAVRAGQRESARLERSLAEREAKIDHMARTLGRAAPARGTRFAYPDIVGESDAMVRLLRMLDRVAQSEVPVMIFGESGSGKELVARAVHANSSRAQAPFVSENCGAIPEGLLESALFGHVRGAFTGADRSRVGLFEAAEKGTLFLDEVAEMSLGMQAKLLRVLEDGFVRPVGSERGKKLDVRVIVATHRDLEKMVADHRFREDLYYRLNIISLRIPPLRERSADIPLLVRRLGSKHAPGRSVSVSRAAMQRLVAYPWPGNVRQLENEIRRALVLSDGEIDVEHLTPDVGGASNAAMADAGLNVKKRVDLLEATLVREALNRTRGNQTQAAKLLGLSRFGLQKMIKRLQIT